MQFTYQMQLDFSAPVQEHHFTMKCIPPDNCRQSVTDLRVRVEPDVKLWRGEDSFGNHKIMGYLPSQHSRLGVLVSGSVRVCGESPEADSGGPVSWLGKYPTPLTHAGSAVLRIRAAAEPDAGDPDYPLRVMRSVHDSMTYVPGDTGIRTTAEQAARNGRGVCQDYAHIMLAVLRYDRIPCRYVCGMMTGEGASHAWVEVLEGSRWVGYDPTNLIAEGENHIVISCGRDALDCELNQGVFRGSGIILQRQTVRISVRS